MFSGSGAPSGKKLNENEERLMSLIGWISVNGIEELAVETEPEQTFSGISYELPVNVMTEMSDTQTSINQEVIFEDIELNTNEPINTSLYPSIPLSKPKLKTTLPLT